MKDSLKRARSEPSSSITPFTQLWMEKAQKEEVQPPIRPNEYASMLAEWGYIVIPLYETSDEQIQENQNFQRTLETMPEFLQPLREFEGEVQMVKGGFGALGNPSSFHNHFVRQKRHDAMAVMIPIFKAMQAENLHPTQRNTRVPSNIEQIIDRMRVLRPKAQISAETWHRDTTPEKFSTVGDLFWGGWINFDLPESTPQLFSAFPKSHRVLPLKSMTSTDTHGGFEKATKEQITELNNIKEAILTKTDGKGWYIQVPPGHLLVFQQEMVHEVVSRSGTTKKKNSTPSYRLFTGWRLTNDSQRFLSNQFSPDRLEVPRLKSGQNIDMWPQATWKPASKPGAKAPWDTLEQWSKTTFKPAFLEDRRIESGGQAGETKHIVPRRMYGMNDVSIKLQALEMISYLDEMNDEIPEIYVDVVESPPAHWRERWSENELTEYFIDPGSVFYEPYTEDDLLILTPTAY